MKANGLIAKLSEELRGGPETPPEGYKSSDEIAEENGISVNRARAVLSQAHKAGLVDRVSLRGRSGHRAYFYKVK